MDARAKAKEYLRWYLDEPEANGLMYDAHSEIESIVDLIIEAAVEAVKDEIALPLEKVLQGEQCSS